MKFKNSMSNIRENKMKYAAAPDSKKIIADMFSHLDTSDASPELKKKLTNLIKNNEIEAALILAINHISNKEKKFSSSKFSNSTDGLRENRITPDQSDVDNLLSQIGASNVDPVFKSKLIKMIKSGEVEAALKLAINYVTSGKTK